jgi:hypothetical protein
MNMFTTYEALHPIYTLIQLDSLFFDGLFFLFLYYFLCFWCRFHDFIVVIIFLINLKFYFGIFVKWRFLWNWGNFLCQFYHLQLFSVKHELPCVFCAKWAFPCPVLCWIHQRNKCLQIKTLSMIAFMASHWSFYNVPAERIDEPDSDLVDLDFIFFISHKIFQEIWILYFLFWHNLRIQFICI